MLRVVLLRFEFDRKKLGLSMADANKFYRKLYGYHGGSFYGKYHYCSFGVLGDFNGKKIAKSSLLIPKSNFVQLKEFLVNYGATIEVVSDKIFIGEEEYNRIKSMGK